MPDASLETLKIKLRKFAKDREWEQFHSPKNLAMALTVETAELLEKFQWLTEEQSFQLSEKKKKEVEEEIGDILIYLVRIADQLNVNLLEASAEKLILNAKKYPIEKAKGRADKYTEL
jgi:NTP pyrophosphatase (non-canonical NTP hydrolase)